MGPLASCDEHSFAEGQSRAQMNYLSLHIKMLSRYLSVDRFHEVGSEYQMFADERHRNSVKVA
jgi:FMN-dependent NADH-azoreductase